jgi:starch phosphorylase
MTTKQSTRSIKAATRPADGDVLARAAALARNLWWSWNHDAQNLFASIDPVLWEATSRNPLKTIRLLAPERRSAVETDRHFSNHLDHCERQLARYLNTRTWFDRTKTSNFLVAYFCAEYAIHESLPQYSGGLGVLAGDHVKSASDLGLPFVGIGLLYRNGFYTHEFNADGTTRVTYPQLDFADLPITDTGKTITVPMGRGTIKAKIWRQQVGRAFLLLLDTDIAANKPLDRALTRHLYGGDREYRIRQEILLGIGGVMALDAMSLKPTVYHLNEGHAAFCALERLRRFVATGMPFDAARKKVRATTVFTTHTPVPAGNDRFAPPLTLKYLRRYADALGISEQELLGAGREQPGDAKEEFCMTVLALRLAEHCNGVAALHGDTSRHMWTKVYNVDNADMVPIGSITNGVHSQTWLAEEMLPLYDKYLKPTWLGAGPEQPWWKNAERIPAAELWHTRTILRTRMVDFIRARLADQLIKEHAPLDQRIAARTVLDPHALTFGFARRFATYKRAPLIFHDRKRLAKILSDPTRPVQLVFAGKAHPQDMGGQAFAREIFHHAQSDAFRGRVVLLENYDMQLGRVLTSGADVWLNNPLRPQEASGTSGMKPPLHGGLNCSILDGWWPEAFNKKNGWSIGDGREFKSRAKQDRYDAGSIYDLLENEIVPLFYQRDRAGLPLRWIDRMKNSIATVCSQFNTHRMVGEYFQQYYLPASVRTHF